MRARGPDCEVVLSAPHQECLFATDASPEDCAVRELLYGDAAGKIQVISLLHAGTPMIGIGAAAAHADGPIQNAILAQRRVISYWTYLL